MAARMVYVLGGTLEPGMVQARVFQDAWNMLFFSVFAIVVAVLLNWKNSKLGYWLNLWVITAADVGFIIYVLVPGHAPMMPGAIGPILWLLALGLTTVGLMKKQA